MVSHRLSMSNLKAKVDSLIRILTCQVPWVLEEVIPVNDLNWMTSRLVIVAKVDDQRKREEEVI